MKNFIVTFIVLIFTSSILSAQIDASSPVSSNINLINEKIYTVRGELSAIRNSLWLYRKKLNKHTTINDKFQRSIDSLEQLINGRKLLYQQLEKKVERINDNLKILTSTILPMDEELQQLIKNFNNLREDHIKLKVDFEQLQEKVNKLPKLLFCEDCLPLASIAAEVKWIPTFNSYINDISTIFALNVKFRLDRRIYLFLQYTLPFDLSIGYETVPGNDSYNWETDMIEVGGLYNLNLKSKNYFGVALGPVLSIGRMIDLSRTDEDRKDIHPIGLGIRTELYYSEIIQKNPVDIYISLSNYLMLENLILEQNSVKYDLGLYHVSLSIGIQFNFFGIF
ncbi:MAG: hypothetical protein KAH48_11150 [Chlorobi bacterium]|nr:hypothetical protein [Chlorobiota bacterium]